MGGLSPLLRTPLPPSDTTPRTSFEDLLGTPAASDPTAAMTRSSACTARTSRSRSSCSAATNGLSRGLLSVSLSSVWKVYAEDDPSHAARPNEAQPNENALPGLAPATAPGLDPVELLVDGETFVVTRRAGSTGTYDFAWTSHPASYGFTIGSNADWHPDRVELAEQIRSFLADIDPETGYLRD